jgi:glycosyltransferase involved in cell wall biosynthesis
VEAQAEGTPVLALGRGGARETVATLPPNRSGMFFAEPDPAAIAACVRDFTEQEGMFSRAACRAQAALFAPEVFRTRFAGFVDEQMALHRDLGAGQERSGHRLKALA